MPHISWLKGSCHPSPPPDPPLIPLHNHHHHHHDHLERERERDWEMGNCQAAEAATAVIQHPGGRVERLYWPTTAAEVMQGNPGHYVAVVTLYLSEEQREGGGTGRLTRVRLLKPKDTLLFGQVYRLISSQEVTKAIQARKHEKMKQTQSELIKKQQEGRTDGQGKEVFDGGRQLDSDYFTDQVAKLEKERKKSSTQTQLAGRARQIWRPSLQSISEVGS